MNDLAPENQYMLEDGFLVWLKNHKPLDGDLPHACRQLFHTLSVLDTIDAATQTKLFMEPNLKHVYEALRQLVLDAVQCRRIEREMERRRLSYLNDDNIYQKFRHVQTDAGFEVRPNGPNPLLTHGLVKLTPPPVLEDGDYYIIAGQLMGTTADANDVFRTYGRGCTAIDEDRLYDLCGMFQCAECRLWQDIGQVAVDERHPVSKQKIRGCRKCVSKNIAGGLPFDPADL